MSIVIKGSATLRAYLASAPEVAKQAIAESLVAEAESIMTRSKRDFVPVDQAILKGSGHVKEPEIEGTHVSVTMGYGGAASAYALAQHERVDYHHEVGQAKYLEQPVREAAKDMGARLARRIGGRLRTPR